MSGLFVPFGIAIGCWLAFGIASMPEEHKYREPIHRLWSALAMIAFVVACGLGGAIAATYIPPPPAVETR